MVYLDIPAYELGATVIRQILEHSQIDPNEINEVILGNVLQAGQGQNPARIAAIHGGVPEAVPSFTVNKVCGSGLKAIQLAYQSIVAEIMRLLSLEAWKVCLNLQCFLKIVVSVLKWEIKL